jgi:hypothetical protein
MTEQKYAKPCDCGAAEDPDQATVCTCAEQEAEAERERQYAVDEEAGSYPIGEMEWER